MMNGVRRLRKQSRAARCCSWCQDALSTISLGVVSNMESAFRMYGIAIGKHPFLFILFCLILAGISSIGFIKFREDDSDRQFMSTKSRFKDVLEWQKMNFREETHQQMILFESDNIYDKYVLLEMLQIRNEILNMTVDDITWDNICAKRDFQSKCNSNIPSEFVNFCQWQESKGSICWEESILEVWNYDEDVITNRTQEQILNDLDHDSPDANRLTRTIGGANRHGDANEHKKSAMHTLYTEASLNKWKDSYKWEDQFMERMAEISKNAENVTVYYFASSSFGKIIGEDITEDLKYLFAGFILVFLYVTIMLGKFNLVEQRPVLSLLGLSCIGLSLLVSYGLSSAFDIPFGAMNSILPFLLLGLGIDDMFVIMTAWNNIPTEDQNKELPERIGIAMQHAGVSITVTSVTNCLAFLIGSSTALPGLRYFCLYAAIGIASIYFFQATFFVAWLSLDQRRLEDTRQGLCWCWKLSNWYPNNCSQADYCRTFFLKIYGRYLFTTPAQIFVMFFTGVIFFLSIWGVSNLQQDFDPKWFLPRDSDIAKFFSKMDLYYPSNGVSGKIFFGNISYLEWPKFQELVNKMKESKYISRVDSWYEEFDSIHNISIINQTDRGVLDNLTDFLYSCEGSRYLKNFRFLGRVDCSDNLPAIMASNINYMHAKLATTKEKMKAVDDLLSMVDEMDFQGFAFPFTVMYITWETNYVIGKELIQNLILALVMVFLVSLLLLASLSSSLMVMICVLATLVDVAALMHWWGLTIDTISAIDLVLAIGLSVDYAAHVAHTFLTLPGTPKQRARLTVGLIGPAVLNGGFTTFLSFAVLMGSNSYVFITFFKVFFGVSLYGVYHGLVFLPVLLSLIGPAPYPTARPSSVLARVEQNKNLVSPAISKTSVIPAILTVSPSPPTNNFPSPTSTRNLITTPSSEPDKESVTETISVVSSNEQKTRTPSPASDVINDEKSPIPDQKPSSAQATSPAGTEPLESETEVKPSSATSINSIIIKSPEPEMKPASPSINSKL